MSFCPNCGKELVEGEVCTCANQPVEENTAPQPEINTTEAAPQPEYTAPQPEYVSPEYAAPDYAAPQPDFAYGAPYFAPPVAPSKPQPRKDYPEGYKIRKKYVAVLLGYCLGVFGIHNFYLGNKNKGLAQVLLATVGAIFTFGISTAAVAIWSIVETTLILTEDINADANGFKIQTLEEAIKD